MKNKEFKFSKIHIIIEDDLVTVNNFTISAALLKKLWLIQFITKQVIKLIILVAIFLLH